MKKKLKKHDYKLDLYEQEIVDAIEKGAVHRVPNMQEEIKMLQEAAQYTRELRKKTKNMNIRLAPVDIEGLKKRAEKAGLPYQTLIGVVLHKVATGQIEIEL